MISGLNACSPFWKTCCSEDVSTHLKMCLPQLRCVYRRPSAAPAFVPALAPASLLLLFLLLLLLLLRRVLLPLLPMLLLLLFLLLLLLL